MGLVLRYGSSAELGFRSESKLSILQLLTEASHWNLSNIVSMYLMSELRPDFKTIPSSVHPCPSRAARRSFALGPLC